MIIKYEVIYFMIATLLSIAFDITPPSFSLILSFFLFLFFILLLFFFLTKYFCQKWRSFSLGNNFSSCFIHIDYLFLSLLHYYLINSTLRKNRVIEFFANGFFYYVKSEECNKPIYHEQVTYKNWNYIWSNW